MPLDFNYHGHDSAHDVVTETELVLGLIGPEAIPSVVYVGVCCGYEAGKIADLLPDAEVHAIEPVKETFDIYLRDKRECCAARVKTFNYAIAGHDGTIDLYLGPMNTLHSVLQPLDWNSVEVRSVPCMTLKSHYEQTGVKPGMIVIDAEGTTLQVLKSAGDLMKDVRVVMAETEPRGAGVFEGGDAHEDVNEFLESFGLLMVARRIPSPPVRQFNSVWVKR